MNKFLRLTLSALCVAGTLAAPMFAAGPPKFLGFMMSDSHAAPAGFYSFRVDDGKLTRTALNAPADQSLLFSTGGAALIDNDLYMMNIDTKELLRYDPATWQTTARYSVEEQYRYTTDITFDPATGELFACFRTNPGEWNYYLGTIDISNGEVNIISQLTMGLIGITADADGTLYAVTETGDFVKVDKSSGRLSTIGKTGMTNPEIVRPAPMACDMTTGKIYMARLFAFDYSVFYEIDKKSGKATQIVEFPNQEYMTAIYFDQPYTAGSAPAFISPLDAEYNPATGRIDISFTAPSASLLGTALSGSISYKASAGNAEVSSGTVQPGAKADFSIAAPAAGMTTVAVVLEGSDREHSVSKKEVYVGYDSPAAPADVKLTREGSISKLAWSAPALSVNNNAIDPAELTYTVKRLPDGKTVAEGLRATEFSETFDPTELVALRYEVIADNHGSKSESGVSSKVVCGPGLEVPYAEDFSTEAGFDLFTVTDVAGDGVTWVRYQGDAEAYASMGDYEGSVKNDWLVTPAFALRTGVEYKLTFDASNLYISCPERLEVKLGRGTAPASMNVETLMEPQYLICKESFDWHGYTLRFTVPEDGDYNIGFHAMSDAGMFRMGIDNVRLQGASQLAPAEVTEFKATPAPLGAHNFTLEFTAPDKAVDGSALKSITEAEISLNGKTVKTLTDVTPGAKATVEIEGTLEGFNDFGIICRNASGDAIGTYGRVYTGLDTPAPPKGAKASIVDGKIVVSWDVPEGANGGYVDPAGITYIVARYIGGQDQEIIGVTEEKSYTDESVELWYADKMTLFNYLIAAMNDAGTGRGAVTDAIYYGGEPYALPFRESLAQGFGDYNCANASLGGFGGWYLWGQGKEPTPYDNDGGSIYFQPVDPGDAARISWGNMTLKGSTRPTLEFYYYNDPTSNIYLNVEVNPATRGWQTVRRIDMDASQPKGWTKVSVPLTEFRDEEFINFAFSAYSTDKICEMHLDCISVTDLVEHNLSVSLDSHRRIKPGTETVFTAKVSNLGTKEAGDYTVELLRDGETIASASGNGVKPGENHDLPIKVTPDNSWPRSAEYSARLICADDMIAADNETKPYNVTVDLPKYPVPALSGKASMEGEVELAWTEPDLAKAVKSEYIIDDFDSYEPWLTEEFGEWTTIDRDGGKTFGLIGFHFPAREEPKSFQVFSLASLGVQMADDETTWRPHSGDNMLVSMQSYNGSDDWLISPELSGEAQDISIYARSAHYMYGLETYSVMISSGSADPKDFREIDSDILDNSWTELSYSLPEGTKYFAIRCISPNAFAMCVDDIMFKPATGVPADISLLGYNVYADGELITPSPLTEPKLATTLGGKESRSFAVTAVYNCGESARSNRISLVPGADTAVDVIESDSLAVSVSGRDIMAPEGALIYNAAGLRCGARDLAPGVYIVRLGHRTAKVVIR